MSKEEIKSEINKVLDTLPDNALQDLLSFLKSVGKKETGVKNIETLITKVLGEDSQLLNRLAK